MLPGKGASLEGTYVCPNVQGASNWYSPSYQPLWELQLAAATRANPMSFAVDGTLYVANRRRLFVVRVRSALRHGLAAGTLAGA